MRQRHAADDLCRLDRLGSVSLQELEAGGGCEEQILHVDFGAGRQGRGPGRREAASLHRHHMRVPAAAGPRCNGQAAHRADRGQRLAPETQVTDIDQIIIGKLRCGVAFNRQRQILRPHADAVVRNTDQALAAAAESDVDLPCPGINGVLDEFLHHARRTLDHLAGGDAVDGSL